jgi:hypothetical protein
VAGDADLRRDRTNLLEVRGLADHAFGRDSRPEPAAFLLREVRDVALVLLDKGSRNLERHGCASTKWVERFNALFWECRPKAIPACEVALRIVFG